MADYEAAIQERLKSVNKNNFMLTAMPRQICWLFFEGYDKKTVRTVGVFHDGANTHKVETEGDASFSEPFNRIMAVVDYINTHPIYDGKELGIYNDGLWLGDYFVRNEKLLCEIVSYIYNKLFKSNPIFVPEKQRKGSIQWR